MSDKLQEIKDAIDELADDRRISTETAIEQLEDLAGHIEVILDAKRSEAD